MGKNRYKIVPRRNTVPKQIHVRLNDKIHSTLLEYATVTNKPVQDCVAEALVQLFEYRNIEKPTKQGEFTFIDLFAGIGGMRIAFEQNGGECVFTSEWDRYCQKTYFDNFGVLPRGDITQISAAEIPDHDILVAGFPCQPFSIAGVSKKKSLGRETGFLDETQGTLFFDVVRILDEKRPKSFLLENVKNLKSHDRGRTWTIIMDALDELNYQVFTEVLDGQDYSPQHRERVIIVGFDRNRYGKNMNFQFDLNKPEKKPVIRDILEDRPDNKYTLSDHLWEYLQNYAQKHREKGNGFGFGLVDLDGVSRTLSARYYKDGSEILIPQQGKNPRRLTPRECARLQGYDDSFSITVSDTQAYKQFGNSVVVPLISAVAEKMIECMELLDTNSYRGEKVG